MPRCQEYNQVLPRYKIKSFLKFRDQNKRQPRQPCPGSTPVNFEGSIRKELEHEWWPTTVQQSIINMTTSFSQYKSMTNILKMKSISAKVHWHKLQVAALDKQLPPFNTEDVDTVSTKPKCWMTSKGTVFLNRNQQHIKCCSQYELEAWS